MSKRLKLNRKEKYILDLYLRRVGGLNLEKILSKHQFLFITDKSKKRIAALCSRQSGKTIAVCVLMLHTIITTGMPVSYCGLTRKSMRQTYNKMVKIDKDYNLHCKFKFNEMTVESSNGGVITMFGLDDSAAEVEKLRGQTNILVVIDECGHYKQNLRTIIEDVAEGTVKVLGGNIVLLGTPGNILGAKKSGTRNDFFYKVTIEEKEHNSVLEPGWRVHKWNSLDNPYVSESEKIFREEKLAANPNIVKTNSWRREVLGEWVADDSVSVFHYTDEMNKCEKLPQQEYIYCLGIDFGWADDTALVVCAYGKTTNQFYFLEYWSKPKQKIDDISKQIDLYRTKYSIHNYFSDHAPAIRTEIESRLGIHIQQAEKLGKYEMLKLMDDDLLSGNIQVLIREDNPDDNVLVKQFNTLIWDEQDQYQIMAGLDDHVAHAALYAWRMGYHYIKEKKKEPVTKSASQLWVENHYQNVQRRIEGTRNQSPRFRLDSNHQNLFNSTVRR